LARNPGTVKMSTKNSKAKVISCRCGIFRPAIAVFRIIATGIRRYWLVLSFTLMAILVSHLNLQIVETAQAQHNNACPTATATRYSNEAKLEASLSKSNELTLRELWTLTSFVTSVLLTLNLTRITCKSTDSLYCWSESTVYLTKNAT